MIEKTVLDYLAARIEVPVLMEMPETLPAGGRFVLIEKVGETVRNHVRTSSFAFQSHSLASLYEAAGLDEEVRGIMDAMAGETDVSRCHMASNYNFTDTRAKRYRYQCVYDITYVQ